MQQQRGREEERDGAHGGSGGRLPSLLAHHTVLNVADGKAVFDEVSGVSRSITSVQDATTMQTW